jgi:hypothetical protein
MNKTWTSGAIELLRHTGSHIKLNTAFDKRIFFISIDDTAEIIVSALLKPSESFKNFKLIHHMSFYHSFKCVIKKNSIKIS